MSIFETIGMAWVIFTASLATIGILYLSLVGLKVVMAKDAKDRELDMPIQVKEMFKVAR